MSTMKNESKADQVAQIQIRVEQNNQQIEDLYRSLTLNQVRSTLNGIRYWPISTLLFFSLAGIYGLYFTVLHQATWYFAFSGLVVAAFSVCFVIVAIRQLYQLLSIDYQASVPIIQQAVGKLHRLMLHPLRLAAWVLPFAPFIGLLVCQAIFQVDLSQVVDIKVMTSFGGVVLVLEMLAFISLRYLKPPYLQKAWMKRLMAGSGSQISEALARLREVKRTRP